LQPDKKRTVGSRAKQEGKGPIGKKKQTLPNFAGDFLRGAGGVRLRGSEIGGTKIYSGVGGKKRRDASFRGRGG